MNIYRKPATVTDLREAARVILAHGEVTGHCHEVIGATAQYFEEQDGRRVLLALEPCVLRHDEHAPITLDPAKPEQARQGDVFLNPIGIGAWEVIRQSEYRPEAIRSVAD